MMTRMIVLASLFGLVATPVWGQDQTRFDLLFHGTGLQYEGSVLKDNGLVGGLYTYLAFGAGHALEGGATRTRINYVDGFTLEQNDVTVAYNYLSNGVTFRVGAHFIDTNDALTDGGGIVFGNLGLRDPYVWNADVGVAVSRYPNFGEGLSVLQLSPGVGLSWRDTTGYRYLYAHVRGHYIGLSDEVGLGKQHFVSMQASVDYYYKRFTANAFVWSGEQVFAVRQGGFTAYNLSEKHTGGYGGSLKYAFGSSVAATVGLSNEQFRDIGFVDDVSLTTLYLSLGFTL
jgi:hypothetical protein